MNFILVVAFVSLLIGLSKGGMGAVLAVLITPLLSQVMPVPKAISISLPLLLFGDIFALYAYWKKWDLRYIKLLLPTGVVGIIIGIALLGALPDITLRRILGGFALSFVAYRISADRLKTLNFEPQNWHGYVAGLASGIGSGLANVGAPPFTAYMLLQPLSPDVFVGTTTLFFFILNVLKFPTLLARHLMNINDTVGIFWALPIIPFGVWVGRWLIVRINRTRFERFMLVVLVISGLYLLISIPTVVPK